MERYRNISINQYHATLKEYSKRVFDLFDKDKSFNSHKGDSLLWLGSFTARYCACDVIDKHIDKDMSMIDALIEKLKECCPNAGVNLDKLINY